MCVIQRYISTVYVHYSIHVRIRNVPLYDEHHEYTLMHSCIQTQVCKHTIMRVHTYTHLP